MEANGHPQLAMVDPAVADEPLSPVVGPRMCRISRPMPVQPDYRGRYARAWVVDIRTIRSRLPPGAPPDATIAHWVLEAPWSSEVVHSYSLIAVHLRFDLHHAPVARYLEGATHEVALMAIHPMADREAMLRAPTEQDNWLRPTVFAAQFVASDDEAAGRRLMEAIGLVGDGRLSPHPTHFRAWAALFGDNMLRRGT